MDQETNSIRIIADQERNDQERNSIRMVIADETRRWKKQDLLELRDIIWSINQLKRQRRRCWNLLDFLMEEILPLMETGVFETSAS